MTEFVVFDIETVRNDRADDYYKSKVYKADGRIKDPAKMQADIDKKRAADSERAGLNWVTGKVCCICWMKWNHGEIQGICSKDETEVIKGFISDIVECDPALIGKSSEYFDIPFLVGRLVALNLGVPPFLRLTELKYGTYTDIDQMFGKYKTDQKGKLEDYAFGCDLGGKAGDGSMVQGWYNDDKLDTIMDYCKEDVRLTAELFDRFMKGYIHD